MSEPEVFAHRSTLLVGYGAFGLEALRRLLDSSAPRGVLRWDEPEGGGQPGERSLQDLALLWVPDRWDLEGQQVDEDSAREGSSVEWKRDLYRQIEEVRQESTPEEDLAAALESAAERLLSATKRSAHTDASPLGLDVVVLARPTGPDVVGILDRMLAASMKRLANSPNLTRAVQGAETLNFVEILDFENYWDQSAKSERIRRAVFNSVERWQRSRRSGEPAFGRIYMVDGRTQDGHRDARHRIDEISLFLEFLLFEGQRAKLYHAYQSSGGHESPLCTFGIRMMERSAGLLSRLAAARFSVGWLSYMAGDDTPQGTAVPASLAESLAPYGPEELDQWLHGDDLRQQVKETMVKLEEEMLELEPEDRDWVWRLRGLYEREARQLEKWVAEAAAEEMSESQEKLQSAEEEIRAGIDADLCHDRRPVPLGAIREHVEKALEQLEASPPPPEPPPDPEATFQDLAQRHAEYLRFHEQRLDVERNKGWWPLFALMLAVGLVFPVVELLESIPAPDPLNHLLVAAHKALQWVNNPLGTGLFLFLLFWAVGALLLRPRVARRVERGRLFYKHPQRGRFVARLRQALGPGGALSEPPRLFCEGMLATNALSIRGEIRRQLGRIDQRLRERHREMEWLRRQMREFLTMHGLSFDGGQHELSRLGHSATGIRHSMEKSEDFEEMLAANPPSPERYRSTQANHNPFIAWQERYSTAFLYPIDFVDRLSLLYRDPVLKELAQTKLGPEQEKYARHFLEFLKRHSQFDLALSLKQQEGLPPDQRFCLLPARWRRLPGILPELSDLRVQQENVLEGTDLARAYLLRLQVGISSSCLVEGPTP